MLKQALKRAGVALAGQALSHQLSTAGWAAPAACCFGLTVRLITRELATQIEAHLGGRGYLNTYFLSSSSTPGTLLVSGGS